ncbi:MAG: DNA repair protein RadC [Paludibacteraceae bacterium]|nr:DNA repair protein RadC [Paludibacteraceae bacterium]
MQNRSIMGIKGWKEDDRPREKCLTNGVSSLSDSELLAILIGSGTKNLSAVELGRAILKKANYRLSDLGRMGCKELCTINGIGDAKAITIIAALELGRRRKIDDINKDESFISSRQAADVFIPLLADLSHEEFWVMFVNHSNKCISKKRVSSGGIHQTAVDPKLIFKEALQNLATGIILCHNHPSGNTKPSDLDISLTRNIQQGAETLDIRILDHIIVSGGEYFSFSDNNIL